MFYVYKENYFPIKKEKDFNPKIKSSNLVLIIFFYKNNKFFEKEKTKQSCFLFQCFIYYLCALHEYIYRYKFSK